MKLATGMHFSVICAEDMPRLDAAADRPGADFGADTQQMYREVCKTWPRGAVPEAFYTVPPAPSPVLVLSGGADPVTPPRHGESVTARLAAQDKSRVQHVVVPEAGHGVTALPCMKDVVFRFIDAKQDAEALPQDAACATRTPRPLDFKLPTP
jgi:pimeloyl-ACP methyl ester carboxylesterase